LDEAANDLSRAKLRWAFTAVALSISTGTHDRILGGRVEHAPWTLRGKIQGVSVLPTRKP
jgi:hypothetical protein